MSCVVVCGVAGSGKTTIGRRIAGERNARFLDADSLHSTANVNKMARGEPLDDEDRLEWLVRVHKAIVAACESNESLVVACSALKKCHRCLIVGGDARNTRFVLLAVDRDTVERRLAARTDHFFPASLIGSQFEALEMSEDLLVVEVSDGRDVDAICETIHGLLDHAE